MNSQYVDEPRVDDEWTTFDVDELTMRAARVLRAADSSVDAETSAWTPRQDLHGPHRKPLLDYFLWDPTSWVVISAREPAPDIDWAPVAPRSLASHTLTRAVLVRAHDALLGPWEREQLAFRPLKRRHQWFRRRRRVLRRSAWADAIGPLYSIEGVAAAMGWSVAQVHAALEAGDLLAIKTAEGQHLFPSAQVVGHGIVRGLHWILDELPPDVVDRYTLAAWLNAPRDELHGDSVWRRLRGSTDLPPEIKSLVLAFRASAAH